MDYCNSTNSFNTSYSSSGICCSRHLLILNFFTKSIYKIMFIIVILPSVYTCSILVTMDNIVEQKEQNRLLFR